MDRFQRLLSEQLEFLRASCALFDEGRLYEAVRIAVSARVLVHDTSNSTSVLHHLGVKESTQFLNTRASPPDVEGMFTTTPQGWPMGMVGLKLGTTGAAFFPMLGESHLGPTEEPFAAWWQTPILEADGLELNRSQLVLGVANKEGGAHADAQPADWYALMSDPLWEGAGIAYHQNGDRTGIVELVPSLLRQIGYELVESLIERR